MIFISRDRTQRTKRGLWCVEGPRAAGTFRKCWNEFGVLGSFPGRMKEKQRRVTLGKDRWILGSGWPFPGLLQAMQKSGPQEF